MKILLLNCITDNDELSDRLVDRFADGLKLGGAEVKEIIIKDLDIKPCFSCTAQYSFKYDDHCRCQDDMNNLYPEFRNTDNWIFAGKVDKNGSLVYLKNLLDRMEPLFQPIDSFDGFDVPSSKNGLYNGKIVFLSSIENDADKFVHSVVSHIDSLSILFMKEFSGTLIANKNDLNNDEKLDDIVAKGKKFAETGNFRY